MTTEALPRLILLCGLPGSGKTTLARHLAAEIAGLRLAPDEWMTRIGMDLRDEDARDRIEKLLWDLAQELLRVGVTVILESGFWLRSDRDEKRLRARAMGVPVELRYLDLPIEELAGRLTMRNQHAEIGAVSISRSDLEGWLPYFEAPDETEMALCDAPSVPGSD